MSNIIPHTVKVIDEMREGYNHIPGAPNSGNLTLCGWVDIKHDYLDLKENPVNCPHCLGVLRYCRNLKFRPTRTK